MNAKAPAPVSKRIPVLHFSESISNPGSNRSASGAICQCGEREFTASMVCIDKSRSLWLQCTICKQSYRVTIYE